LLLKVDPTGFEFILCISSSDDNFHNDIQQSSSVLMNPIFWLGVLSILILVFAIRYFLKKQNADNEEFFFETPKEKFKISLENREKFYKLKEENNEDKVLLGSILMNRAIDILKLGLLLDKEGRGIKSGYISGYVSKEDCEAVIKAEEVFEKEVEEIKTDANELKEGFGEAILPKAYNLLTFQEEKKTAEKLSKKQKKMELEKQRRAQLFGEEEEEEKEENTVQQEQLEKPGMESPLSSPSQISNRKNKKGQRKEKINQHIPDLKAREEKANEIAEQLIQEEQKKKKKKK